MTTSTPPTLEQLPLGDYHPCSVVYPPTLHDVTLLHCRLPFGHRSAEHWTGPLWRGHVGIVWADDSM